MTMMVKNEKEEKKNSNEKKDAKRMCGAFDFNSFVLCAKCKADERKIERNSSLIRCIVQTFRSSSYVLCGVPHVSLVRRLQMNLLSWEDGKFAIFRGIGQVFIWIGSELHRMLHKYLPLNKQISSELCSVNDVH